ncbi:MAG TPA: hypothetical protein VH373_03625 [Jatrophihabitantaceae bacterium]|jgi:hypothetical protein
MSTPPLPEPVVPKTPGRNVHVARLRRVFLTIVVASSLLLIPWITYLAVSLPDRFVAGQWKAAWVGFDIALLVCLTWTAWNAWQRRQMLITSAMITATLLVCDAWFDVVLDWGTDDMWWSLGSALLIELPLAALLLRVAVRLIRMLQRVRWAELGHHDQAPPLWRMSFAELIGSDRLTALRKKDPAP